MQDKVYIGEVTLNKIKTEENVLDALAEAVDAGVDTRVAVKERCSRAHSSPTPSEEALGCASTSMVWLLQSTAAEALRPRTLRPRLQAPGIHLV